MGLPLGVMLAGHALGRNGGYGWALLGSATGSLLSVGLEFADASANPNHQPNAVMLVSFLALPLLGSVLGFELSSDSTPAERPTEHSAFNVMPGVSAVPGGGTVGLAGTF